MHLKPFWGYNFDTGYQPFTTAELCLLLNALDGELHDITMMGLYSGARLEELASLEFTNIVDIERVKSFDIK